MSDFGTKKSAKKMASMATNMVKDSTGVSGLSGISKVALREKAEVIDADLLASGISKTKDKKNKERGERSIKHAVSRVFPPDVISEIDYKVAKKAAEADDGQE